MKLRPVEFLETVDPLRMSFVPAAAGASQPRFRLRRDHAAVVPIVPVLWDVVLAGATAGAAWLLLSPFSPGSLPNKGGYVIVGVALIPAIIFLGRQRADGAGRPRAITSWAPVFVLALWLAGCVITAHLQRWPVALWFFAWMALLITGAMAGRLGSAALIRRLRERRMLRKRLAIVGATAQADVLLAAMQEDDAVEVLGVFDDARRATPGGRIVKGTIADLTNSRYSPGIDGIIVAPIPATRREALDLVRRLMPLGAEVTACTGEAGERDLDLVRLDRPPLRRGGVWVKTLLDRLIALVLLAAFLPVMLLAMLAIVIESAGPPIFLQRRHGLGNREFQVLKLRTMTWRGRDAADGSLQTCRRDLRVTKVGGFLRRTSLDELPQLVNVLRGDMSLVGPRPHPVAMLTDGRTCSAIVPDYALRHRVKPGLTGLAQINGCRGATSTAAQVQVRFEQDIAYIQNCGPLLDLCILLLTPIRLFLYRGEAF